MLVKANDARKPAEITAPGRARKVVFFHVMKTGGMTFRAILSSIYGDSFHVCEDPSVDSVAATFRDFDCIEFHTAPFQDDFCHMHGEVLQQGRWDILEGVDAFTMLRDPVDQAISQYFYMVEKRNFVERAFIRNGVPFPESLEQYAETPFTFNNQLAFLAGKYQISTKEPLTRADLAAAKDMLVRLNVHVGLTERYADWLHVFESVTGRRIPERKIENQNRTLRRLPVEGVPPGIIDRIREQSALDIELYEFARELFEQDLRRYGPAPVYTFSNPLLGDSGKSRDLTSRGYTVQPFLDAAEIEALANLYRESTPSVPSDYYVSAFGDDVETRRRIREGIIRIVGQKVKRLAPGYRILNASFVTKRANGAKGKLDLHQDISLADQSKFLQLNAWCPLMDVDERNGCLRVVEGSHGFGHIAACPPNPEPYFALRPELDPYYLTDVPMQAGQAFLFDSRLLHATDANRTSTDRISAFVNLIPEGAPALIYYWNEASPEHLEVYEIDEEFVVRYAPNRYADASKLGGRFVGRVEYRCKPWSAADLAAALGPRRNTNDSQRRQIQWPNVRKAIAFLRGAQLSDGAFRTEFCEQTRAAGNGRTAEDLVFESSPLVTSQVLRALRFVRESDPAVPCMIEQGCRFLESDMEPGGLWRRWPKKNENRLRIPPDLDDTSCISQCLRQSGVTLPDNQWLFSDTRDSRGAFVTWVDRADSLRKWLLRRRTGGQAFSHTGRVPQRNAHDDVCAVVNANVIRYLGETRGTKGAIQYLRETIRDGSEDRAIVHYAHRFSLYYAVSGAYAEGVGAFAEIKPILIERIGKLRQADGSYGDELLTALAICSLLNLGVEPAQMEKSVEFLIRTQQPDGSWRRIAAYGGPSDPKTFGSPDLTTAICLEALTRQGVQASAAGSSRAGE